MPPKKRAPARLASVAQKGDRLATLRSLRQRLAREIDAADAGADITKLSRQLVIVLQQIDALTPPRPVKRQPPVKSNPEKSVIDEIRQRRAARQSGTDAAVRAPRGGD